MKSKSLEILVGFFIVLGIGAIFILTFRVASLSGDPADRVYSVNATFSNIGGLKPGAAVTMAGVRIGRVREISADRKSFEAHVRMDIKKDYDNIPSDSVAKILTAGLLGEQYVGIDPGGDEKVLGDGGKITMAQPALVLENLVGQMLATTATKPTEPCK